MGFYMIGSVPVITSNSNGGYGYGGYDPDDTKRDKRHTLIGAVLLLGTFLLVGVLGTVHTVNQSYATVHLTVASAKATGTCKAPMDTLKVTSDSFAGELTYEVGSEECEKVSHHKGDTLTAYKSSGTHLTETQPGSVAAIAFAWLLALAASLVVLFLCMMALLLGELRRTS